MKIPDWTHWPRDHGHDSLCPRRRESRRSRPGRHARRAGQRAAAMRQDHARARARHAGAGLPDPRRRDHPGGREQRSRRAHPRLRYGDHRRGAARTRPAAGHQTLGRPGQPARPVPADRLGQYPHRPDRRREPGGPDGDRHAAAAGPGRDPRPRHECGRPRLWATAWCGSATGSSRRRCPPSGATEARGPFNPSRRAAWPRGPRARPRHRPCAPPRHRPPSAASPGSAPAGRTANPARSATGW